MSRSFKLFFVAVIGVALTVPSVIHAEDFYKGKTIHFICGNSPGGGFDLYTRLIARHISKYIPGAPTTIVENMTGANGIIAANHVNVALKPDGLTIGAWAKPLIFQNLLGSITFKFDPRELGYLGGPATDQSDVFMFNKASGIEKASDLFSSKRTLKIAGINPGSGNSDIPKVMKAALNLPFQVLDGYKGGAEARLAVESGEADGICVSWDVVQATWRGAYEAGLVRAVLQVSITPNKYTDVPLAISYAKTDEARQLITLADSFWRGPFIYSLPAGVPKDRLAILQKAFVNTLNDPELLAEAKKSKMGINPTDGPTLTKTIQSMYAMNPAMVAKLKEILLPKQGQ